MGIRYPRIAVFALICYNWLANPEFISKVYAQENGQQRKRYVQFLSEEGI